MADLKKHPGCPTGSAVVTGAGRLPAKYVFHAVGPVYRDGRHKEPELLASCYKTALRLAIEYNCESISFPAISAGVYGYPFRDAAEIALSAIAQATSASGSTLRLVKLVQFSQPGYDTYHDLLINFPTPQTSAETS
jgi:O-acetyl-ADP-ribose deacetylase (regulator of RNase III)